MPLKNLFRYALFSMPTDEGKESLVIIISWFIHSSIFFINLHASLQPRYIADK